MLNEKEFFRVQTDSSRIKANIVAQYFPKYARILLKQQQKTVRYMDLFAGPGLYGDQSHSTPLLIGKTCSEDQQLSEKVHLLFNDKIFSEELKTNFLNLFPEGAFSSPPRFGNLVVGENEKIHEYLAKRPTKKNPHPTLLFFDPWGYKGIDTKVLGNFLGHWGNEIFLFVNIKRIHAAIENDKFDELMDNLFPTTIEKLRTDRKYRASVHERLSLIMDNLATEFQIAVGKGPFYHCAFKFQEEDSNATSHFIIHFTKHKKGYELVKQIYYDYDNIGANLEKDGVYTFDAKRMNAPKSGIVFGDTNLEALSASLEKEYKGQTLTAKRLFDEHHPKNKYSGSHYLLALRDMVDKNKIISKYTDNIDHNKTVLLIDHCTLTFI